MVHQLTALNSKVGALIVIDWAWMVQRHHGTPLHTLAHTYHPPLSCFSFLVVAVVDDGVKAHV